jgi:hypothetical protein
MRCVGFSVLAAMLFTARAGYAQQIPTTVTDAEVEGASFPHDSAPAVLPAAYRVGSFQGSIERRCVQPARDSVWLPTPSLRSGEMIVRGYTALQAGQRGNKMLWMPLHDPGNHPISLVIRGVRVGHPSDMVRQTIPARRVARQMGQHESFGMPTTVRFPTAGQWLVIADDGDDGHDWGCFVLNVAERTQ